MSKTAEVLATKPRVEAIRSGIDDTARKEVSGLLVARMTWHEKTIWMLRAVITQ